MITMAEHSVPARVPIQYSDTDKDFMKKEAQDILDEIAELSENKKSVIYPNQQNTAQRVAESWADPTKLITMVLAMTQSGKTGTMLSLLKILYESDEFSSPPLDNIFIITGLSDLEWKKQTCERMPPLLKPNIYHRPNLKKHFLEKVRTMKDVIIIIDEAQIASKKDQTLYRVFKEIGLFDIRQLTQRNIRIVMFTATPSGLQHELEGWGPHQSNIIMELPENYTSPMDLLTRGNVKEFKNISGITRNGTQILTEEELKTNLDELKEAVSSFSEPKYHLIRVHKGTIGRKAIENVMGLFSEDDYEFLRYFINSPTDTTKGKSSVRDFTDDIPYTGDDINQTLLKRPRKHTIIFIKDRLRCAKTLIKKHVGIEYERLSNLRSDEVVIQSVRLTGYDCMTNAIVFSGIDSIMQYQKLFDSQFGDKSINWKSSTTSFNKSENVSVPKETFLNTGHVIGLE